MSRPSPTLTSHTAKTTLALRQRVCHSIAQPCHHTPPLGAPAAVSPPASPTALSLFWRPSSTATATAAARRRCDAAVLPLSLKDCHAPEASSSCSWPYSFWGDTTCTCAGTSDPPAPPLLCGCAPLGDEPPYTESAMRRSGFRP